MKKKVLVTLLVIALALSGLWAKSSAMKVGVELGLGLDTMKSTLSGKVGSSESSTTTKYKNSGFAVNLTGEYAIDKNWSVKLDGGLMFAGKASMKTGDADAVEASETSGLYMDFALDGKYTASINKQISASAFGGVEMVIGHVQKTGSEDADKKNNNVAFGLNFGGEMAYAIDKSFSIVAGCDFAWLFVNNCEAFKNSSSTLTVGGKSYASAKYSNYSLYLRPYVGAAYAF